MTTRCERTEGDAVTVQVASANRLAGCAQRQEARHGVAAKIEHWSGAGGGEQPEAAGKSRWSSKLMPMTAHRSSHPNTHATQRNTPHSTAQHSTAQSQAQPAQPATARLKAESATGKLHFNHDDFAQTDLTLLVPSSFIAPSLSPITTSLANTPFDSHSYKLSTWQQRRCTIDIVTVQSDDPDHRLPRQLCASSRAYDLNLLVEIILSSGPQAIIHSRQARCGRLIA
ncbi:hypothetical protein L1887_58388 [Cichorium endivia]|nr:hypothetical protein L1887_58388 [Cichorium endivia]